MQDIQEVAQYLELKFRMHLQWKEARLRFYNIKQHKEMNSPSPEEKLALLIPIIVFWTGTPNIN